MGDTSVGTPPFKKPLEDRLDSWKEIAAYLKRDVTTVQRWEKREGMPIHRHLHDRMGSVYASRTDLDAWMRSRTLRLAQENADTDPTSEVPAPPPSTTLPRRIQSAFLPLAAISVALAIGVLIWLQRTQYFWRDPLAGARFQTITDFDGLDQAAAISRDGHLVAFLSDRDGPVDIWVTQVGSGEFHNLTHGTAPGLVNPLIRNLGFSLDGSLVTYWARKPGSTNGGDISVWAVPVLGGEPRPYLDGIAEFDWSNDGSSLAYHTPGPGDPLFVSNSIRPSANAAIFTAAAGLHSHFPVWAPDGAYIYFVQGSLPDKLDIWRIQPSGGTPERITFHNGLVKYPVLLDRRTLIYLAGDQDGSGPWLYGMNVARRIPHLLTQGFDRYTSLAASTDGRRLVVTLASPKRSLWRLRIDDSTREPTAPSQIPLTTSTGFSPRVGPGYLLYVSANGSSESIWKLSNGTSTELWQDDGAHVFAGPSVSPDGQLVAFSVRDHGKTPLYVMQADGTHARIVTESLNLQGGLAWAPDGRSITLAVIDQGVPHLVQVNVGDRSTSSLVREYSIDPAWSADGHLLAYSGPDIGTTFSVKAVTAEGAPHPLPPVTLTRGARHLAFLPAGQALVVLRGDIKHKDLWLINLETGAERQLTHLSPDFDIGDFDISPDGREVTLERVQERSQVVLLELPQQ